MNRYLEVARALSTALPVRPPRKANVYVIDPSVEAGHFIRGYLKDSQIFELARWHRSAKEALRAVATLRPDIFLINLGLPGTTAIECMHTLKRIANKVTLVVMNSEANLSSYVRCFQAGADGFFLLPGSQNLLEQTLTDALDGWKPFPREIQKQIVDRLACANLGNEANCGLTPAERRILGYLALGLSDKEISTLAGNATATVHSLTSRIYKKLGVHSREEAVGAYLAFTRRRVPNDNAGFAAPA